MADLDNRNLSANLVQANAANAAAIMNSPTNALNSTPQYALNTTPPIANTNANANATPNVLATVNANTSPVAAKNANNSGPLVASAAAPANNAPRNINAPVSNAVASTAPMSNALKNALPSQNASASVFRSVNTAMNARKNVNAPATVPAAKTVAPVPLVEKADLTNYLNSSPPYSEAVAKQINNFYKKREKNPSQYTYSDDGNLVIFSKSGAEESGITLKNYVAYDSVSRDERDQNRLDTIGEAESRYEDALKKVREATESYRLNGATQPVLAAQKAMAEADQILSRIRYGSRAIKSIPNPEVRDILFDQPYESRKLISEGKDPFDKELARLIVLEYHYNEFYGTYSESDNIEGATDADATFDKAPDASEMTIRQKMKNGKYARIFFEADDSPNGFLSPFWPVEFTLDDTKYFTGLQAYEALRAEGAGQLDLKKQLLGTRSTRTMRFLTKKLEFQPGKPKDIWLKIFTAIYQQHPILKEKLLATDSDTFIFADIRKGPSGTGLGERDAGILVQTKWLYENAVGSALEELRYKLREGSASEVGVNGKPTEAVISTDQQSAAKVAGIINAKRKFQFKK
jgi:predicted NAD-dependent protein-ADP-ribosyltransferase YbiA (DUF1768 family)